MMPEPLTLVCPSAGPRLRDVIETALCDLPVRNAQGDLRGARILFALDAGSAGMDEPTLRLLRRLRSEPGCLEGSVCGFVVDGETELYTKALAQDSGARRESRRSGPARQAARGGHRLPL